MGFVPVGCGCRSGSRAAHYLPRHLVRGVASEAALYLRPEGRFCGGLLSDDLTLLGPDALLGACRPLSPALQQF